MAAQDRRQATLAQPAYLRVFLPWIGEGGPVAAP